jgi:anti-sigma-K factor RskA
MDKPPESAEPGEERLVRAAEIALGLGGGIELDPALGNDPTLAREIERWNAAFATLVDELEPAPPRPRVWAALARVVTAAGPPQPANGWFQSLALWRTVAATSLATALVFGALFIETARESKPVVESRAPLRVASLAPREGSPLFIATYDASQRSIVVIPAAFRPESGRVAEFWIALKDSDEPIPLGSLDPLRPTTISVSSVQGKTIDGETGLVVTSELAGAAPSPASPGPLIAHGRFESF